MPKYIYAYDPIIGRRVAHVVKNGWAISLVTGNRFWYGDGGSRRRRHRKYSGD